MRALAELLPAITDRPPLAVVPSKLDAAAVLARPPSPPLQAALDVIHGPLVRIETPDARWPDLAPRVTYAIPSLPADAVDLLPVVQERLSAAQALLEPASFMLRRKWALCFANAVERRFGPESLDDEVDTLAGFLDLPAVCFLADVNPEPGELPDDHRFRRMIVRVRYAAKACGGWWASYGKLEPILAPFAQGLRAHARQLADLATIIREMNPQGPSGDVSDDAETYLANLESQPADAGRRMLVRLFRAGLSAEQLGRFGARLDALSGPVEPASAPRVVSLEHRPLNPEGIVARHLAQMAAERRAQAQGPLEMDDDALRRLMAEKAALVDLTPLRSPTETRA